MENGKCCLIDIDNTLYQAKFIDTYANNRLYQFEVKKGFKKYMILLDKKELKEVCYGID